MATLSDTRWRNHGEVVASTPQPHVLVVDDAPQIRDLFGEFLTMSGMAVTFAEDGFAGLAQARLRVPDVIVCDLDMPNMDGVALCHALRTDPVTKHVHILVVSGSDAGQAQAALEAGCDAVLAKPCSRARLVETIQRLLAPQRNAGAPSGLVVAWPRRETA